jgi:hypothetical protein
VPLVRVTALLGHRSVSGKQSNVQSADGSELLSVEVASTVAVIVVLVTIRVM